MPTQRRLSFPIASLSLGGVCVLMIAASSCAEHNEPEIESNMGAWSRLDTNSLDGTNEALAQRARAAQNTLGSQLMGELSDAIAEQGTPGAIEVCSQIAPAIARRVSDEHGLRIGRTSWRLRNPDNSPPVWARPSVERRVETQRVWRHESGTLAMLTPIRVSALCLQCHGSDEQISDETRARLDELYPEDDATGFAAGDLRGWFWVEVDPEG